MPLAKKQRKRGLQWNGHSFRPEQWASRHGSSPKNRRNVGRLLPDNSLPEDIQYVASSCYPIFAMSHSPHTPINPLVAQTEGPALLEARAWPGQR